jgi:hypothetical protein
VTALAFSSKSFLQDGSVGGCLIASTPIVVTSRKYRCKVRPRFDISILMKA